MKIPRGLFLGLSLLSAALLSGCDTVLMNASGDVAAQQGKLIVVSTVLMLLIIVPVIALTIWFAWHYRHNNSKATYTPDWDHSTSLELIIWAAPLLIIIALGAVTWISTHTLDPYRPLRRLDAKRLVVPGVRPIEVQVVALDWKWLFIYPELGIAVVNELAAPVDVPINFKITASSVMNSFFIPSLAGQIYAMPGMQTQLHAVMNKAGDYDGFSANYSGAGFSDMKFRFHGMSHEDFDRWVKKAKASGKTLNAAAYQQLEQPTIKVPVSLYGAVDADLFEGIVNRCVGGANACMSSMMMRETSGEPAARTTAGPGGEAGGASGGGGLAVPGPGAPSSAPKLPAPAAPVVPNAVVPGTHDATQSVGGPARHKH